MFPTSILYLSSYVFGQNYILTPKDEYVNSFDVHKISGEHNLQIFSEFKEFEYLPFYITSKENVLKYKTTLSQFFDIEEDVTISLSNEKQNFVLLNENTNNIRVLQNTSVPWHLDRIVKEKLPLDGTFPYTDKGSCHQNDDIQIDTYVVDTGIDVNHPQFENRAVWANNFVDSTDTDCNNHGTHVAGLIGSKDYGVCKDANLYAVKVLDCRGSGSLSGVIKGIEWVYKAHVEKTKSLSDKKVKSIINMSLGGGFSRALNKAIEYGVKNNDNFYVVVAAGNENEDACKGSPSSVKSIFTVMASDISDNRAWFSNWGECADIYSPGVDILSTIPNGETAVYSGTSMASPVMAGVLNHYIDLHSDMNMKQIKEVVLKSSSKNVINGVKRSTTSNLIYLQRKF